MSNSLIYIANSNDDSPYGITVARLDTASGALDIVQQVDDISECHYLNFHPNGKFLVATTTDNDCEVVMFAVDEQTGHLSLVSRAPAEGTSPAYCYVDDSGHNVLIVNYAVHDKRGNIRVYPINDAGELQPYTEMIEHDGGSVDVDRQQESHPHMIVTTPDNQFAVVPDLGTDKVYLYALDTATGKLSLDQALDVHAGAGPRHVAFHPTLPRMYVINELDSTLVTFEYHPDNTWEVIHRVTTLPAEFDGESYCADVHVHPNGKFLYGSNRGHDSIVIFSLDGNGVPTIIGHESTRGHWPRAFMLDNAGDFLIVGNRRANNLAVFAIDSETGFLTHKQTMDLPAPIAFKMFG